MYWAEDNGDRATVVALIPALSGYVASRNLNTGAETSARQQCRCGLAGRRRCGRQHVFIRLVFRIPIY